MTILFIFLDSGSFIFLFKIFLLIKNFIIIWTLTYRRCRFDRCAILSTILPGAKKKKKKQKNFSSALAKTFDLVLIICEKLHSKDLNSIGCCIIGGWYLSSKCSASDAIIPSIMYYHFISKSTIYYIYIFASLSLIQSIISIEFYWDAKIDRDHMCAKMWWFPTHYVSSFFIRTTWEMF